MRAEREQDWHGYARAVLFFSALSFGVLYLILRTQSIHPFNPLDLSSGPGISRSTPPRRS